MKKRILFAVAMLTLMASQAFALSYNQNITPGVIYGTGGNGNGGWTVDQNNNIEVGLRTKVRMPVPLNVFNSNGNGTYSYSSTPLFGNKSSWNYDFSVNLNLDGNINSTRNFSNVSVVLGIDLDPTAGQNFILLNPVTKWIDNAYGTNSTATTTSMTNLGDKTVPTNAIKGGSNYVMQNSQNSAWAGLNPNIGPATYDFELMVYEGALLLAKTEMTVLIDGGAPVPEPGTMVLLGLGLAGLAVFGKRRINKA